MGKQVTRFYEAVHLKDSLKGQLKFWRNDDFWQNATADLYYGYAFLTCSLRWNLPEFQAGLSIFNCLSPVIPPATEHWFITLTDYPRWLPPKKKHETEAMWQISKWKPWLQKQHPGRETRLWEKWAQQSYRMLGTGPGETSKVKRKWTCKTAKE